MKQRLGDYIKEYSARNKNNEDIPVYSVTNTHGFCKDYFGKEVASKDKTTYKIVPQGCFAYNPSRINVGSVDWQRDQEKVIVSPLYNVFSVSDKLDNQYLYYYLKSNSTLQRIRAVAIGSVRDNLKLDMLFEFPINVYELQIQKEIAYLLDKVKKVMGQKEEELRKLDELIKARFVEMFGDMADPRCKWDKCRLVDACADPNDIKCGPFGTQLGKDEYTDSGIEVWEIPQINSEFKTMPTHFVTKEKALNLEQYSIRPGDIAMSRKGNVGRCAVFPESFEEGIIHSDVLRIRVDDSRVAPEFMMRQLHYSGDIQHQIELVSSGAIMAGINVTKLKDIFVYVPPKALQDEFVSFVKQTDKSKVIVMKMLLQVFFMNLRERTYG